MITYLWKVVDFSKDNAVCARHVRAHYDLLQDIRHDNCHEYGDYRHQKMVDENQSEWMSEVRHKLQQKEPDLGLSIDSTLHKVLSH